MSNDSQKGRDSAASFWANGSKEWIIEHDSTYTELARRLSIDVKHLNKLRAGTAGASVELAEKAALLFGCNAADLIDTPYSYRRHPGWTINSRKGLRQDVEPYEGPPGIPFQDFVDSDRNRVSTAYIWCEVGDWLRCSISEEPAELGRVLQVEYFISGKGSAPNLAIHPQGQICRKRVRGQDFLCFQARAVAAIRPSGSHAHLMSPVLSIRVGDSNHFQWVYSPDVENRFLPLGTEFRTFYFPLSSVTRWKLMSPYSSSIHKNVRSPKFEWLTTLVIDFGFGTKVNNLTEGHATVEIKNVCLCSDEGDEPWKEM